MKNADIPRVYLTLRCNLSCSYCANGHKLHPYDELGPDEWLDVFDSLPGNQVIFTGGEPTLYPKLAEVLNGMRQKVSVYSNMTTDFDPRTLLRLVSWRASCHARDPEGIAQFIARVKLFREFGQHVSSVTAVDPPATMVRQFRKAGLRLKGNPTQRWPRTRNRDPVTCSFPRVLRGPDGGRYHCVSQMCRGVIGGARLRSRKADRLATASIHWCDEPHQCYPCDVPVRKKTRPPCCS